MKKVLASLFALIMAVCCFPITASAETPQDMINYYFGADGIEKPQAPYIQYTRDVSSDKIMIWYDQNDDLFKLITDMDKDHDGFYEKYDLTQCLLYVQFDCRVDDGSWQYVSGNTGWDDCRNYYYDDDVLSPLNPFIQSDPDWYNRKTQNHYIMDTGNFDPECKTVDSSDPRYNNFLKNYIDYNAVENTFFLNMNHKYGFRYRFIMYIWDKSDNEQYVISDWSDEVSIGKGGSQATLTKSDNPAAVTINSGSCEITGTGDNLFNDFSLDLNIPQSVYNDEKYYIIYEEVNEPVALEFYYRINGGQWKSLGSQTSVYDGNRLIGKVSTPLKKDDKVEFRLRVAEGRDNRDIKGAWSNTVAINALVTEKDYKEPAPTPAPAPKPEPAISSLDGSASENQVTKFITGLKNDKDPKGASFAKFPAKQAKVTNNSVKLSWNKVKGAKYYLVYGNKCGSANRYQYIGKTSSTSFTQKKLKKGTYYKYLVSAFDANGKHIATSLTMHIVTKGEKFCNYKSVTTKAKKNKVALAKKGKTFKLGAKAVKESKKLKTKDHRKIRYESTDKKIAVVDANGKITAKKKGVCYVYAFAQNGINKKIKVTVKK